MDKELNYDKLREMIARCQWTFAKTMPFAPHEYIVKDKCPLTTEQFEYFVNMQREHGVKERWGNYYHSYLYIDDYKYWTMGAPIEETTVINRAKTHVLEDALTLHDTIVKIREELEEKSPYYVNVISELQPNELLVSKILAGFFKQRFNGEYYVLKDFVRKQFGESLASQIKKPIIEAEEGVEDLKRIDILIYEKGKYAIVFENKIWDAPEQPKQLANYIKGMRATKYQLSDEQVYIVYLPSTDRYGPSETSWDKNLQKQFAERYRNISFREGILEWMKSLNLNKINDDSLKLSQLLFIDYLNRVFNLTEQGIKENKMIEEYIHDKLGLQNNNKSENIAVLTRNINEISECVRLLERIRKDYCCQVVDEITQKLEGEYEGYTICKDQKFVQSYYTGIAIPYRDKKDAIYILIGFEGKNYIYGATCAPDFKSIRGEMFNSPEIARFYSSGEFGKGSDWLFYKNVNIDDGYESLKQLIERML